MTYKIIASPIKGQKVTKTAEGVHDLHDTLADLREQGYAIKQVRRLKRPVVQLTEELQAV